MKKLKNKKLEKVLGTLIEILEFVVSATIGIFLFKTPIKYVLVILLMFFISRFAIGKPGHYKIVNYFDGGWRRCVIWTSALVLSLFLASKMGIEEAILFAIFTVFIISGRANIDDTKLGFKAKGEPSKYADIEEYINSNDERVTKFEKILKDQDNQLFLIYKYRFKDGLTFSEISSLLDDYPTQRLTEKLDAIALSIRIFKEL